MRFPLARRGRIAAAIVALAALTLSGCATPTPQESGGGGEDVAMPEQVSMLIPYSEGGGTDTWARFLAPYLEKYVEGSPNFVPENVPGGESITGSNQFVRQGGTNGETVLITSGTTYFQALLGRREAEFDFAAMRPLILNGTGGVIYVSADAGITSVQDLANPPKPLTYGGISATGLDLALLLAMEVLEVPIDATFGFEGRGPARLALERGEVNLDYQTTSAYLTQVAPLVEDGTVIPLMSFGTLKDGEVVRDPNVPDLPTVSEVYKQLNGAEPAGQAFDAYRSFFTAGFVYQKGIWGNEGTPDSIAQPYYDAARQLNNDKEFQAASKEVLGGYPLYSGEEVADEVREAFQISDDTRQYVLNLLETRYGTTIEGP